MTWTLICIGLVLIIVFFWLYKLVTGTVLRILRSAKEQSSKTGRIVQGEVVEYEDLGEHSGGRKIKITLELPNYADSIITEELTFVDSRPRENRFDVGKRIPLSLDDTRVKPVQLVGGQVQLNKFILGAAFVLIAAYLYGMWFLYAGIEMSTNWEWAKLERVFSDELLMQVGVMIPQLFIIWIVTRATGINVGKKAGLTDRRLKYHGIRTTAQILKYEDTGTLVNHNPLVKFFYSFTDKKGNTIQSTSKLIVGKLDIGLLPQMKEKDIMYLPKTPKVSKFVEGMSMKSFAGCFRVIFLFVIFIQSVVLMVHLCMNIF